MKTVKGELWTVFICGGAMDFVHGNFIPIKEIHIPKYGISFNVDGFDSTVHVFKSTADRYSSDNKVVPVPSLDEHIEIPEKFAKTLKQFVELKENIFKEAVKLLPKLSKGKET